MKKMIIQFLLSAIVFLLLLTLTVSTNAQHGLSYNQFGQLRNAFNSSLSTMDIQGSFSSLGRSQWTGVDGAPGSVWLSGNMGFQQSLISIGLDTKHAGLGVVRETEISVYMAKAVRLSGDEYLSLSMGGGFVHFEGNYTQLDPDDSSFGEDIRRTDGLLGISTSYYRKDRYYFGISMPRFTLNRDRNQEYEFRNVYYITAGGLIELDQSFHLRPSLLVSHVDDMDPRYDVSAMLFMARKLGLGMGVQNQGDLSALMQVNFGNFGLGYSYQFNVKNTTLNQRISTNTHEVGLRYRIGGVGLL